MKAKQMDNTFDNYDNTGRVYLPCEQRRELFVNEFTMFAALDPEFQNKLIAIYDSNLRN